MWFISLILLYLIVVSYRLDKRVHSIEEKGGPGYSHKFSVNIIKAVLKYKKFGEIAGIKSIVEGKEFKDWTKNDVSKWRKKYANKIIDETRVLIDYLQSENVYFVRTYKTIPFIVQRDGNKKILYSTIIAGDENGLKDNITFILYERYIDNYGWFLTPCLEYQDGQLFGKNELTVLCDFPLFRTVKDEEIEKLGFDVDIRGGDDIYKDSFGEDCSVPLEKKYKKNGVEIEYIF